MNFSYEIAKKHVQISEQIYRDVADCRSDLEVYLATHSRRDNYYEIAEKTSGLEFWGISLYANEKPSGKAVKRPDCIVAYRKRKILAYILEIKWGLIPDFGGTRKSDLLELVKGKDAEERAKIRDAISEGRSCRVRKRKFPTEDPFHKTDFGVTEETRFLLISDFYELIKCWPECHSELMEGLDRLIPELVCLDYLKTHDSDFGVIESFRDYISSAKSGVSEK